MEAASWYLDLFLLNRGFDVTFYESEYNKYYEEAIFENSKLSDFKPDIIYLHTTNQNISSYPDLSYGPDQINDLTEIQQLRLEYNYLTGFIPETLCDLNLNEEDYLEFDLTGNYLCPPYPECLEGNVGYQNDQSCFEIGDVNQDGMINVVDIIFLVHTILNSEEYIPEGDVNQDGLINISDIVSVVSIILN